jgi:DegV family protein with EDD domain
VAIKIVTDSTADLPDHLAESLGIAIVPAYVVIDDVAYREGVDITRETFYDRMQATARLPTTSQPTPQDFSQVLEPLVGAGHQVICVTLSKKLSGTYNSAVQAAADYTDGAVSVVDSNSASAGHMLQVLAAAEDATSADATLESVLSAAQGRPQRCFMYFALDTLENLQKGGRIGRAQAFMGSLLKVKPILQVLEGEVVPVDRPRNMRRALQRLEELVRSHGPATKMATAYTTDQGAATALSESLSDLAPADQVYNVQIGSAVGTHGGPGAVAVAMLG